MQEIKTPTNESERRTNARKSSTEKCAYVHYAAENDKALVLTSMYMQKCIKFDFRRVIENYYN